MQRTLSEALVHSKTKAAYRVKDDGLLFFCQLTDDATSGQFWTQCANGKVRRFTYGSKRREAHKDWKPLMEGNNEYTILMEKNGEPPGEGSAGWTKAIGASPVNVAMRHDKDGRLMIRRSKDRTWLFFPPTNDMILLRQGFRHYGGWEPMPENHPLARSKWNEERIPFHDPAFILKDHADKLEEWVQSGSRALLKAEETRLQDRNEQTHATIREAHMVKASKDPVIDEPSPHVLENIGSMTEALASTVQSMIGIGHNDLAVELATALKHLVGNASYLLRNDRTERLKQKAQHGQRSNDAVGSG